MDKMWTHKILQGKEMTRNNNRESMICMLELFSSFAEPPKSSPDQ